MNKAMKWRKRARKWKRAAMMDINEVAEAVGQRLHSFEGRYTDHYPRWTLRDYAQVSILVSGVLTLLNTIRELQARVAELETALAGHRVLDQTHALTDAEGEITLLRHKLVVQHDALDTCHQALIENGDIVRGLTTEKQVLQARVAELEAELEAARAELETQNQTIGKSYWICEDCGKACTPDDGCHCSEYPNAEWPKEET